MPQRRTFAAALGIVLFCASTDRCFGQARAVAPAGNLFGDRMNSGKAAAARGGGEDTEAAVDRALEWLAAHQLPDGSWSFNHAACPACEGTCANPGSYRDSAGATALALLPFLGKGFTHKAGPYQKQVAAGLKVLADRARENDGCMYDAGSHDMYVQGLATIALVEATALSADEHLRAPTQAALDFIMDAQDPQGGGWRYVPQQPGDTSATGWQIVALRSGHVASLEVNPVTVRKAADFLDSMAADGGAGYGYTEPGAAAGTTAVGLLCRMYLGWKKDHPALQRGVANLAGKGPSQDLHYDYFATQVMHEVGGDAWTGWNDKMKALLLAAQVEEGHEKGSWYDGVSGGHGPTHGGRLYTTAMAALILEVYYRRAPLDRDPAAADQPAR